jgi:opacity protein-like surface antigen
VSGLQASGTAQSSNAGQFLDLFLGTSYQFGRIVIAGQLEATAADINLGASGTKTYTYFGFGTGQTAVGDFRPQISARWMTSALARTGILLDDQTLLYGLGGWSGAQLEARNVTDNPFYQPSEKFWANGWTAGGGIERKLDSRWSIRAEYRYTDLGTVRTTDQFAFTSASSFGSGTQTSDRQSTYQSTIQSGRIGIAYTFDAVK